MGMFRLQQKEAAVYFNTDIWGTRVVTHIAYQWYIEQDRTLETKQPLGYIFLNGLHVSNKYQLPIGYAAKWGLAKRSKHPKWGMLNHRLNTIFLNIKLAPEIGYKQSEYPLKSLND